MRTAALAAALCAAALVVVSAQEPASSFDRGRSQQAWQNAGLPAVMAKCKSPAFLFANNDASNVTQLDPATSRATVLHKDTDTGGALSRTGLRRLGQVAARSAS